MPGKFTQTMENLEKIKNTHPNLYNVWKLFLEKRKKRMFKLLAQCDKMVNEIEDLPDIDPLAMLALIDISTQ